MVSDLIIKPQGINIDDPAEILTADVAVRLQLSSTEQAKMNDRLETIGFHIDRPESPLAGKIARLYAQGSASIGATNKTSLENEEYDVDGMVETTLPRNIDPEVALSLLHMSVVGTKENPTKYAGMTKRHTRCVQICYADGMHVDLTPAVLLPEYEERTSFIFHSKPEDPNDPKQTIFANPWGFAEDFKAKTPADIDYGHFFEKRSLDYDRHVRQLMEKAETEPVPEQEPVYRKSRALISLQLIKRWRNIAYLNYEGVRMPPSVLLSHWVAEHANQTEPPSLLNELIHQVSCMIRKIEMAEASSNGLVHEVNPRCSLDVFTDRWPADKVQQDIFKTELWKFRGQLQKLKNANLQISEIQEIMIELFGEKPVKPAVERFFKQQGQTHRSGKGLFSPKTTKIVPIGAGLLIPKSAEAIPDHNFFGGD